MHTGLILLVKANGRQQARKNAEEFLSGYDRGRVCDYYVFGGAWSGILTGYEPRANPDNFETCHVCWATGRAHGETCYHCSGSGRALKFVFNWVPYAGDTMPLVKVKKKVAEYLGGWRTRQLQRANEGIAVAEAEGREFLLGHYHGLKGNVLCDEFCRESVVYDVESRSNSMPECTDGYWAAVFDLHR